MRTLRGKALTTDYSCTFLGGVKTASYQGVSPSGYSLVYGYDGQGRQKSLSNGGGTPFVTGHRFEHSGLSALYPLRQPPRVRNAISEAVKNGELREGYQFFNGNLIFVRLPPQQEEEQ